MVQYTQGSGDMYREERIARLKQCKEQVKSLSSKIENREATIARMIESNNRDRLKLEKISLLIEKEEAALYPKIKREKKKPTKQYNNFDNCQNSRIGLNNSTVLFPVAECDLHKCYLSYQHVRKRKCVMKMCKHLKWIDNGML